ncbi:hemerythrin HHE cation binding domain-containing protein [Litorimonas taeanensis]|uniref:Hemerythrin HHE cation binding domain-containing protein n=1 Tax=Litorimonas taeanensis TaxID=568099 RepID=A0A420WK20_9PROT|nr:hemerythrin domain-containing protein [Litorimonas taeanensis]RKQ71289.1 hemerythrin HHE cation binding domain-containing protein [Litorimonas taeanensis]
MDIYERLEQDHNKQRDLIKSIKKAELGSDELDKLWSEIKVELEAHASAEEQAFYSELMKDPDGTDETRHAVEEHQEMHEMIAELDIMDKSEDLWMKKFEKLAHKVIHHVDEEEADFFPKADKLFNKNEEKEMLKAFNERKPVEEKKQEAAA